MLKKDYLRKIASQSVGTSKWRSALAYRFLRMLPSVRGAGGKVQACDLVVSQEEGGWLYIGVPLTGTRSTLAMFRKLPELDFGHLKSHPRDYLAAHSAEKPPVVFSVVRNPWSRVVSCYNKKILNASKLGKIYFISRYQGIRPMMDFSDFVHWLMTEEGSDQNADPHWLSQWQFLYTEDVSKLYTHLGRLETFEEDMLRIFEAAAIPVPQVLRIRTSADMPVKPLHTSYRSYYNDETRDLIAQRYRKDIELFDYTF